MPEKISIVTDEISEDLAVCRRFLDTEGLTAIELRRVGGRRVPDLSRGDRETLRGWVRAGHTRVLGISPGLFKCDPDDRGTATRHQTEVLPRSIDLARDLGAEFIVAFTFENIPPRPVSGSVLERLWSAAEICAAGGLPLLLENEPGFLAGTGAEIRALLDVAGHDNLFVNWDPANAGDLGTGALEDGLRAVFPFVRHVHVKNGVATPGERFPRYGPLATGDIDWPAHLALLDELGYRGHFGIETHFEPLLEGSATVLHELRTMIGRLPR